MKYRSSRIFFITLFVVFALVGMLMTLASYVFPGVVEEMSSGIGDAVISPWQEILLLPWINNDIILVGIVLFISSSAAGFAAVVSLIKKKPMIFRIAGIVSLATFFVAAAFNITQDPFNMFSLLFYFVTVLFALNQLGKLKV